MQATQNDVCATLAVVIRQGVGAISGGDVDLDDDQVRFVVQFEGFDVFVLDFDGSVNSPPKTTRSIRSAANNRPTGVRRRRRRCEPVVMAYNRSTTLIVDVLTSAYTGCSQ